MRARAASLVAAAALATGATPAEARRPLDHDRAVRNAEGAARKLARQDRRITDWEVTRGFRFSSTKWVFAWWAQLQDGRICTAQVVARYRNSKQNKVIAYFRQEDCE